MYEKRWPAIGPVSLTSNGTTNGKITVGDAAGFKVKQQVILKSNTQAERQLEVMQVDGPSTIHLGPVGGKITERADVSAFTVAASATIRANEQPRSSVPEQAVERLTYEEEPTVARRVVVVDEFGRRIRTDNPLPVRLTDGDINVETLNAQIEVALDHKNISDDPADSVRVGDGVEEWQIQADGEGLVHDQDVHNRLDQVTDTLASLTDAADKLRSTVPYGQFRANSVKLSNNQTAIIELDENGHIVTTSLLQHLSQQGRIYNSGNNFVSTSGTAEMALLLLRNPVGSGKELRLFRIALSVDSNQARSTFRAYVAPTVTSDGTALPILNNRIGGAASVMQSFVLPTVTSFGTLITTRLVPVASPTVLFETEHFLTVPAGYTLLLTAQASLNNTPVAGNWVWVEV